MKKVIYIIFILLILVGCTHKQTNNELVSKETAKIMLEKEQTNNNSKKIIEDTNTDIDENIGESKDDDIKKENSAIIDKKLPSQNIISNNHPNNDNYNQNNDTSDNNQDDTNIDDTNDDEINTNDKNYLIHQGQIDCINLDECIDLSRIIETNYNNIIDSVYYLPVKTNNNYILGYYIDYYFKEYQYENQETCTNVGNILLEEFSTHPINYTCSFDGIMTIEKISVGDSNA